MKNRLKKKVEKRRRQLIHELLDLVLDINGLSEREQSITGCLPTAMFDFSGHVGRLTARIYKQGWKSDAEPDMDFWIPAGNVRELEKAISMLKVVKAETPGAGTPRESKQKN